MLAFAAIGPIALMPDSDTSPQNSEAGMGELGLEHDVNAKLTL
jgi:hypothetical protein